MRKNTLSFSKLGLFAVLAFVVFAMSSCGEDEITGCTDETAENYNPDAVTSDGSCTYANTKFLADYFGALTCAGALTLINTDSLTFSITEALTPAGDKALVTLTSGQVMGISFPANITGSDMTFDQVDIPYSIDVGAGPMDVTLETAGSGSLSADETTLTAVLNINVVTASGATFAMDMCDVTGVKQ